LRLVEAVHLVHEQDGAAPAGGERLLGRLHGVADVLDAREHRRERDELRLEALRHQARERGLARARRAPEDHGVRLARLEGEAQRLARPEQVALPDYLVDRLRSQPLGERRRRLYLEEVIHFSPRTSAPFGGSKRNSLASTLAFASRAMKRRIVVWPKLSVSSIACRPAALKPMRIFSNPASRSFGFASSHSRPSLLPASASSNALSTSVEPASSAAGVEPRARASLRTVTWARPRS